MRELLDQRNDLLASVLSPLPGSIPYDNWRPLNIPGRYDGQILLDVVLDLFPHIDSGQWLEWFDLGHITKGDAAVSPSRRVRGGESYQHLFPETVEPPVCSAVRWVWEDKSIVGLVKPAPLPVHPCGRFNRNTLTHFLKKCAGLPSLRLIHRLDANTTGLMLLAKSSVGATVLREQFESGKVTKRYLARVFGHPSQQHFECNAAISRQRRGAGGRSVEESGLDALTFFSVLRKFADGSALVMAEPKTGRTNQIRVHLWTLGFPVVGDPTYLPFHQTQANQTLGIEDPPMCLHAESLEFEHPETLQSMKLHAIAPSWVKETGGD